MLWYWVNSVLYLECYTFEYIKILNVIVKNEMRNFAKGTFNSRMIEYYDPNL